LLENVEARNARLFHAAHGVLPGSFSKRLDLVGLNFDTNMDDQHKFGGNDSEPD